MLGNVYEIYGKSDVLMTNVTNFQQFLITLTPEA
ncbi:hypothetical protein PAECIP112173_01725 [Paenibacillus sp. JJ-100]|nr:hypothetical protein PAECIP112173_01725 [Paenibacillus sp. JJ-100]